jgi:predicted RNA-binding protein with PUA-like domain
MNYWLVKTEPGTYSWDNLVSDKTTVWDGVKNYQARNNMNIMKKGDVIFIYHSGAEKSIIGTAKVTKEAFPDPKDMEWVAVEISAGKKLKQPVTLAQVKSDKTLTNMALVKQGRLSVQPITKDEVDRILLLSGQS